MRCWKKDASFDYTQDAAFGLASFDDKGFLKYIHKNKKLCIAPPFILQNRK